MATPLMGTLATELDADSPVPSTSALPIEASPTPPEDRRKRRVVSERNKVIAASTGAVVTSLTMTPFDVIKTRLQTQTSHPSPSSLPRSATQISAPPSSSSHITSSIPKPYASSSAGTISLSLPSHLHSSSASASASAEAIQARHLSGFFDAIRQIVRHEGLSAMWRGTAPALAMSVPGQVVYMLGYDWGRRKAFEKAPEWAYTTSPLTGGTALSGGYLTAVPLVCGALSRTAVAALVSPLELVRTRLQSSHHSVTLGTIFQTLRSEGGGLTAPWRGLTPTLWRDVPFSAVYWAGYEVIKRALTGGRGMGEGWEGEGAGKEFGVAFVSGAGSGMIAATLTNPFDVVKTRRQALPASSRFPTSTFPLLLHIAREEGPKALMKGLTPRLAKVGPACGVMVGCYEGLGKWLD